MNKGNSPTYRMGVRTGELTILKAEVLARLGDEQKARETTLELAKNRYHSQGLARFTTKLNALSGEGLLEEILKERRRETCLEGYRWFDVRRLGVPLDRKQTPPADLDYRPITDKKDTRYVIPFPRSARASNPFL